MIAYLSGTILDQSIDRVILDVQGVGYEVWVPVGTQGRLAAGEDGRVGVHVHTSVREDAIQLFGFGTTDEKRVFEKLLSVSGVGPKLAKKHEKFLMGLCTTPDDYFAIANFSSLSKELEKIINASWMPLPKN